jgi:hypothetical protein
MLPLSKSELIFMAVLVAVFTVAAASQVPDAEEMHTRRLQRAVLRRTLAPSFIESRSYRVPSR